MIRFGLRLTLRGGKEAAVRLIVVTAAVALGVGLLLATLAGINATNSQHARYAWLNSGMRSTAQPAARDGLWWRLMGDYFHGRLVGRVDVAPTGPHAPVPPGIPRLPGPGQYYASPALSALLRSTPPGELGDRFPGHRVGPIGPRALPGPDSLVIIIGHTADKLAHLPGAAKVTRIQTTVPSGCRDCVVGEHAQNIDLILSVMAGALLLPVLIFIGTATRLSAARREQRFAAIRLVGATPRQVSVISAVEASVAAVVGTAAGFGVFVCLRPLLAQVSFTGARFFTGDLSLHLADVVAVAVGVPVAAMIAARVALRRVSISPLGVSRRVTPHAPRVYRLIPFPVGIVELGYFAGRRPVTTAGQVEAYLSGFVLIMVGLVVAGPWLTMIGARVVIRRTSRPATLIAARRLSDNPQAGFRAISGLVLALFVTSAAVGVITTIGDYEGIPSSTSHSATAVDTLADVFSPRRQAPGRPMDSVTAGLRSTRGVRGVAVIHLNPAAAYAPDSPVKPGLVLCAQLSGVPAFGRCAAGATVASVYPDLTTVDASSSAPKAWPAAAVSPGDLRRLPVLSIVAGTDGSLRANERARTVLEAGYPGQPHPPTTLGENYTRKVQTLSGWRQLANMVIMVSLAIAGCGLVVSVVAGLGDRRRPFSLLRLTGVPLGTLRRIVILEAAVPLLLVAVVAAGTGFLAAGLYLASELSYTLRPPGAGYYLIVLAGLAASFAMIVSTLPLLRRITGPEAARSE